jgi:hypothetical protein
VRAAVLCLLFSFFLGFVFFFGRLSRSPFLFIWRLGMRYQKADRHTDAAPLSPPTFGGGAFFALLRLVLHTQAGTPIDRSLVFVQGMCLAVPVGDSYIPLLPPP